MYGERRDKSGLGKAVFTLQGTEMGINRELGRGRGKRGILPNMRSTQKVGVKKRGDAHQVFRLLRW